MNILITLITLTLVLVKYVDSQPHPPMGPKKGPVPVHPPGTSKLPPVKVLVQCQHSRVNNIVCGNDVIYVSRITYGMLAVSRCPETEREVKEDVPLQCETDIIKDPIYRSCTNKRSCYVLFHESHKSPCIRDFNVVKVEYSCVDRNHMFNMCEQRRAYVPEAYLLPPTKQNLEASPGDLTVCQCNMSATDDDQPIIMEFLAVVTADEEACKTNYITLNSSSNNNRKQGKLCNVYPYEMQKSYDTAWRITLVTDSKRDQGNKGVFDMKAAFNVEPVYGSRADMMSIECGRISGPDVYATTTEAPPVYPAPTVDYHPGPQDDIATPSAAYPSRATGIYGQPATDGVDEATTHQVSTSVGAGDGTTSKASTAGSTSQSGMTIESMDNVTDEDHVLQDVYSLYKIAIIGGIVALVCLLLAVTFCIAYKRKRFKCKQKLKEASITAYAIPNRDLEPRLPDESIYSSIDDMYCASRPPPPPLPRYTDFPHQGQINQGFVSKHEKKLSEQAVVYSTRAGVADEAAYIYFMDGDGSYTMLQTTGSESQYQKLNNGPLIPAAPGTQPLYQAINRGQLGPAAPGTQPLYQAINRGQLVPANNVTPLVPQPLYQVVNRGQLVPASNVAPQVPQPLYQAVNRGQLVPANNGTPQVPQPQGQDIHLPISPGNHVSIQPAQIPYHVVNSEYTYPIVNRGQFVPVSQVNAAPQYQGPILPGNQCQGVALQEPPAIYQVANRGNAFAPGTGVVYSAAQQQCQVFDSRSPYKAGQGVAMRDQLPVTECLDSTMNAANTSSSTLHGSALLHAIQTISPVGSDIEMAMSRH